MVDLTVPRRPRRRPRALLPCLLGLVLVLLAACSDAPSQAQRDKVDTGTNPDVVTVLLPAQLASTVQDLGAAFNHQRMDVSIVLIQPPGVGRRKQAGFTPAERLADIGGGGRPSIWIDVASVVGRFTSDPRVQGAPVDVADDRLRLVVAPGNPEGVQGLEVFGDSGGRAPKSAICDRTSLCGTSTTAVLSKAKVRPAPDLLAADGPAVLQVISQGRAAAGLVFGSDVADAGTPFGEVPYPAEAVQAGEVRFQALRLTENPAAAEFLSWFQSSDEARAIVERHGLVPPAKAS